MLRAPPAASFPEYPASWYLFCRSHELRGRPMSREMLGRRIAAFRTADGRAVVIDARCYHLGADLGRGQVVGDAILIAELRSREELLARSKQKPTSETAGSIACAECSRHSHAGAAGADESGTR
jgi:hypothetical protein